MEDKMISQEELRKLAIDIADEVVKKLPQSLLSNGVMRGGFYHCTGQEFDCSIEYNCIAAIHSCTNIYKCGKFAEQ